MRPTGLSWLQLSPITMAPCVDRLQKINLLRECNACLDFPAPVHGPHRQIPGRKKQEVQLENILLPWVSDMVGEPPAEPMGPLPGPHSRARQALVPTLASTSRTVLLELKTHRYQSDLQSAWKDHSLAGNTSHFYL